MAVLSKVEINRFRRDGYLMATGAVDDRLLAALRDELDGWIAESRRHDAPWGETLDKLPRFDVEDGHRPDRPRLRRVNNPAEVSEIYYQSTFESAMADMAAALVGPNVKLHHCKINIKLARTSSRVGLHQDRSYTPHTNDDIVTALLLLDDMTAANGPLQVVPGSHGEGQKSLWQDDVFTGQVDGAARAALADRLVELHGKAGDVCLMHTNLVHGSAPNRSDRRRALYISVYSAADAFPLRRSPLPNRLEGEIVRGQATRIARLTAGRIELPADFRAASFFHLTGQGTNQE